jgi:hypothetical protein
LAEQYGEDVASEVLARSRSNLQLNVLPAATASGAKVNSSPPNTLGTKQDLYHRAT